MKKVIGSSLLLCMALLLLTGCGNEIPELDETTRKMVVEYTVDVVKEHDFNHSSRLMEVEELQVALEEEARLEAVFSKDYSTEVTEEQTDTSEADTSSKEPQVTDKASGAAEIQAMLLEEALMLEEIKIAYCGYEVTNSYPQTAEDIYFTMDAAAGNDLIVLKFDVTNTSQSDKTIDILSANPLFKIEIDGESRNALTTMLLNDLSNYQGNIGAGETQQLVLACEFAEEKTEVINKVALYIKTNDGMQAIALD